MTPVTPEYAALHVHTWWSFLDGVATPRALAGRAKALGLRGIATTDHGHLTGLPDADAAAREVGIPRLLGTEAYVMPYGLPQTATGKDMGPNPGDLQRAHHLVLLAENPTGYANLCALTTLAHREPADGGGFYYRPRIDEATLARHAKGLVALSGCVQGPLMQALMAGDAAEAARLADFYQEAFPGAFYAEVQAHTDPQGVDRFAPLYQQLVGLARRRGIPLVATTDTHYAERADHAVQDRLLAIQTKELVAAPNRALQHAEQDYHLWSGEEMGAAFGELPDALSNTVAIAERCAGPVLPAPTLDLPPLVAGWKHPQYARELEKRARHGLWRRFSPTGVPPAYKARLDTELALLAGKPGIPQYLLIVADLIAHARKDDVLVVPRGSVIGSLVGYALDFSAVDPVAEGIGVERFMTPERTEYPDVDMDFPPHAVPGIHRYLVERYGRAHVGQLSTPARMKARAALHDVARAEGVPPARANLLANAVPERGDRSLAECAASKDPECTDFQQLLRANTDLRRLFDLAAPLSGLVHHASVHPAGVVITSRELASVLPLRRTDPKQGFLPLVQYDKDVVADLGFLKLDVLKVEAVGAVERAMKALGKDLRWLESLPVDDGPTWDLISAGFTVGCFQLSEHGMRRTLVQLTPRSIPELCAAISLNRPGPMAVIPAYAERKHGRERVTYLHPSLQAALKETYGVMVFQDQVLDVLHSALGYSWDEADAFRSAIGKKKEDKLKKLLPELHARCLRRGWTPAQATALVALLEPFAGYGFGKGHGTAYAFMAYWSAYLKVHHPARYMAALLSGHMDDDKRTKPLAQEALSLGLRLLPPDLNASQIGWTAPDARTLLPGLNAVKHLGETVCADLVRERDRSGPFASLTDLFRRTAGVRSVTAKTVRWLAMAGALPPEWGHPRQIEAATPALQKWARKTAAAPPDLFALADVAVGEALPELPPLEPPTPAEEEAWEAEARTLLAFKPAPAGNLGQSEFRRHALRRATLPGLSKDAPVAPADDETFRTRSATLFS